MKEARDYFVEQVVPTGASGQVKRVAARFGLVAAGGMLATEAGITGWSKEEADRAATICFNAWLTLRGSAGNREDQQALEQVSSFFQLHGESRFSKWDGGDYSKTVNRSGFVRYENGEQVFYVYPQVFRKEICKGFDSKRILTLLANKELLIVDSGRSDISRKPPSEDKAMRFCAVKGGILDA